MSEQLNVQEVQDISVSGGQETEGGQLQLIVGMAGKFLVDVPVGGIRVRDLPNYDASRTYTFNGQQIDGDFVLEANTIVMATKAHSNGNS